MSERVDCSWHEGEEPEDDTPGCPECSRLLDTEDCPHCGKTFLNWDGVGYDDIVAAPRVSLSGDLCCAGCIGRVERDLALDDADFNEEDFDEMAFGLEDAESELDE